MESGLEDRNNMAANHNSIAHQYVSMESGLEDRNNIIPYIRGLVKPTGSQWSPA